jgi:phosphoglycolate phosphatase-like HAD superfamily hydrolase
LRPEIEPLDRAYEVMAQLKDLGHPIVLASSAIESHFDAFVDDKLDARELADAWTTKDDVDASKPDPDLVRAALSRARTSNAIMIGDTRWDCEAARRAGIQRSPCSRVGIRPPARFPGSQLDGESPSGRSSQVSSTTRTGTGSPSAPSSSRVRMTRSVRYSRVFVKAS